MIKQKEIGYFRTFFEVSQTILTAPSLAEILHFLVEKSVKALGVKAGSLRLVDETTSRLELVASYRLSETYLAKGPLLTDKSVPEVLKGKVVVIKDATTNPRIQYQAEKRDEGITSILSVPVEARDKVIGVLRLYTAEPRDFTPEEIEFVSALAEMGGLAIVNAKIYEDEGVKLSSLLNEVGIEFPGETPRRWEHGEVFAPEPPDLSVSLEYFRMLHEVTRAILATLDSRQVIDLIIDKIITIMKVKACALRLIDETTRELTLVASKGLSEDYLKKGPINIEKSIIDVLGGSPVMIFDTATDPRVQYPAESIKEGIKSILCLPITAQNRVIGTLRLYSAETRRYNQQEVAFLSALAEIAGVVIMNTRFYEKTHYDLLFWQATLEYLDFKGPQKK